MNLDQPISLIIPYDRLCRKQETYLISENIRWIRRLKQNVELTRLMILQFSLFQRKLWSLTGIKKWVFVLPDWKKLCDNGSPKWTVKYLKWYCSLLISKADFHRGEEIFFHTIFAHTWQTEDDVFYSIKNSFIYDFWKCWTN